MKITIKNIFDIVKSFNQSLGDYLVKITSSFWNSNLIISFSTIPIYLTFKYFNSEKLEISIIVIVLTLIKCSYFILYTLEKIVSTYTNDKTFNWFLGQFTIVFFLLILSFGIDNLLIFDIDNTNFNGIKTNNIFELIFDFCYYSFMTFTTVGFGEIIAISRVAKFYSALQVFVGFIFVGYILSGFSSIKEGLLKEKPFNIDYDKVKQGNLKESGKKK